MDRANHERVFSERALINRILEQWQTGEIGPWDVVSEVEAVEQGFLEQRERYTTSDGVVMLRNFADDDPRSFAAAIVELLSTAYASYILPEDIAIMRSFLQTPLGEETEAWQRFDAYWETIDYTARKPQVDTLYFGRHT